MFNLDRFNAEDARLIVYDDILKETNMSIELLREALIKLCEPGYNILNKTNPKKKIFKE